MVQKRQKVPVIPPAVSAGGIVLNRPLVFLMLWTFFALVYLVVPYWKPWVPPLMPAHQPGQQDWAPGVQVLMAVVTGLVGLAWAYLGSGDVRIHVRWSELLWLAGTVALLAGLSFRPIQSDLAWRGDEDHHFKSSWMMAGVARHLWSEFWSGRRLLVGVRLIVGIAGLVWVFQSVRHAANPRIWVAAAVIAVVFGAVATGLTALSPPPMSIDPKTYPLAVTMVALVPLLVAAPFCSTPYPPEWVFRLVPLLSAAGIVWALSRRAFGGEDRRDESREGVRHGVRSDVRSDAVRRSSGALTGTLRAVARGLFVLAVGSVPVVWYYSSILYLEMPAILCMTLVCLGARRLLTAPADEVVQDPRWYAVMLMGFIKDTMVAYVGAFILCRWAVRAVMLLRDRQLGLRAVLGEARVAFCAAAPYMTYAVYRMFFSGVARAYHPDPGSFLLGETWGILARAFGWEYGPVMILFAAGLMLLALRRRGVQLVALVGIFALWAFMHMSDLHDVLGYSRFMLYFAPMVLVGAAEGVRLVRRLPAVAVAVLMAGWAGANLWQTPFHGDGSKRAAWGQFRWDTRAASMSFMIPYLQQHNAFDRFRFDWTEHTYPYREALRYVQAKHPHEPTAIMGLYYQYWNEYYTGDTRMVARIPDGRLADMTVNESAAAEAMLFGARQEGFRHVLWHVRDMDKPRPARTAGFVEEEVFRNDAHMIVLYSLPPSVR